MLLYRLCQANPFTHAVELIRFALYGQFNGAALLFTALALAVFLPLAIYGYNRARGMMPRKTGASA